MRITGRSSFQKFFNKYVYRKYLLITIVIIIPFIKASPQDYFQQKVNYNIQVTLNDSRHELRGFESVEYINNSPDTLRFLYFHLWPNAYSNNNTALARQIFSEKGKGKLFNDPELSGFIDSLDFQYEGKQLVWNTEPGAPDICKIILGNPLKQRHAKVIRAALVCHNLAFATPSQKQQPQQQNDDSNRPSRFLRHY